MSVQLDLFEGKILTTEQQSEIISYIEKCDKEVVRKQNENRATMLLLDEAGFRQGIDYINDFEVFDKTYEHEFGYSYNNTQWYAEVEVMRSSGGCQILFDSFRNGKIEMGKSTVYIEHDKLQCTNITDQYRYYKPNTLKTKLEENNTKARLQFETEIKKQFIAEYTVLKYKSLYPEAEITIGKDYHRNSRRYDEFKVIYVTFKSGSYIAFSLGYEEDKEIVHRKYNAQSLTTNQLLEMFNNQKAQ